LKSVCAALILAMLFTQSTAGRPKDPPAPYDPFPATLGLVFSRDGRYVAYGSSLGVETWNVHTRKRLGTIHAPARIEDFDLALIGSVPRVMMRLKDGRVASSDIKATDSLKWHSEIAKQIWGDWLGPCLAYGWYVKRSNDDHTLYLANLNTHASELIRLPILKQHGATILFSSDGKTVVVYMDVPDLGGTSLWKSHIGQGKFTKFTTFNKSWLHSAVLSADGSRLAALTVLPNMELLVWGDDARKPLSIHFAAPPMYPNHSGVPCTMSLSDNGRFLAVGDSAGIAYVYSAVTGKQVAQFDSKAMYKALGIKSKSSVYSPGFEYWSGPINYTAFSPDSRTVCLNIGVDGTMLLWDFAKGKTAPLAPGSIP